jgi:hypothetical protein
VRNFSRWWHRAVAAMAVSGLNEGFLDDENGLAGFA